MSDDERQISRRIVLGGVGSGMAVLAGCLGGENESDDPAGEEPAGNQTDGTDGEEDTPAEQEFEGESITVTGVWSGGEEESFLEVVGYVEEQTGLSIDYAPRTTEDILTGTLIDYEAGTTPADVVVMPSPARIRSDARNGHLEPVGDTWDPEDYAIDAEGVTVEDEVYAAPFKTDVKPGFWYRQSFFDEHGLEEPEDYDEFQSLLEELDGIDQVDAPIASGNGDGWPLSDITEGFILRQEDGAQLQRGLVNGEVEFTDDRVVTAFEELQQLHQEGYFSELRDFGVQYEYFWDNATPLYFMGSFTPGFDAIQDPDDLGVFELPGVDGMVASTNWFTVPAYSENIDAAKAAVETMSSAEGQAVWAELGGFFASHTGLTEDDYNAEIMVQLTEMADETELVPDLDDSLGNPFQDEFWSQLSGLWADPDQDVGTIVDRLGEVHQETLEGEEE